jgi:hypothetical protein
MHYYSSTAIDNIIEYNGRIKLSSIPPIINGLSDYDALILTTKNMNATINKFSLKQRTRLIDNATIMNFQTLLTRNMGIYLYNKDPNNLFHSFLCPLLNIFQASFPIK